MMITSEVMITQNQGQLFFGTPCSVCCCIGKEWQRGRLTVCKEGLVTGLLVEEADDDTGDIWDRLAAWSSLNSRWVLLISSADRKTSLIGKTQKKNMVLKSESET